MARKPRKGINYSCRFPGNFLPSPSYPLLYLLLKKESICVTTDDSTSDPTGVTNMTPVTSSMSRATSMRSALSCHSGAQYNEHGIHHTHTPRLLNDQSPLSRINDRVWRSCRSWAILWIQVFDMRKKATGGSYAMDTHESLIKTYQALRCEPDEVWEVLSFRCSI